MGGDEGTILKHKVKVKEERSNQQGDNISQLGIPLLWTFEHRQPKDHITNLAFNAFELKFYCKANFS